MPIVILKLFAGQGTRRTDGRTKQRLYASLFRGHNNVLLKSWCLIQKRQTNWYVQLIKQSRLMKLQHKTAISSIELRTN